MKKICFPLFLLTTAFTTYAQEKFEPSYDTTTIEAQAKNYQQNNQLEKAIAEYAKIDALDPMYFEAQYQIILLLLSNEKIDEAEALCKKLIDKYGNELPTNYFLSYGIFKSDQGNYDEALTYINKAKKETSLNIIAKYNEALVYYRKAEKQKALDLLKEIITQAPNYGQAYYLLGIIATEDGQGAIGLLSFLTYLSIYPNTSAAQQCLREFNRNLAEIYSIKPQLTYSTEGDDFSELDIILKNNLAQHKNYPLKVDIDHRVSRVIQALLEYMDEHKVQGGFFETRYSPWMKSIVQNKLIIPFTYVSMISYEENYKKEYKKQSSLIQNYINNQAYTYVTSLLYQATIEGENYSITELDNSFFYHQGKFDFLNGKAMQFTKNYNIESEGFFVDHKLSGLLKRYSTTGRLATTTVYKEDQIDGLVTTFYSTGNVFMEEQMKGEKLEGTSTIYHIAKNKRGSLHYKNNELVDEVSYYFPTGQVEYNYPVVNGKRNGEIISYNEKGTIVSKYNYKDDLFDGLSTSYFPNGAVKSEALFKDDNYVYYKEYFEHGLLSYHYEYENGNLKVGNSYNIKGELIEQRFFDTEGNLSQSTSYYKGDAYLIEKYKKEKVVERQTINPSTKKLEVIANKGYSKFFYPNGQLYGEGQLVNGAQEGVWKYYSRNGILSSEFSYVNNNTSGEVKKYDKTGQLEERYFIQENGMTGLYSYYNQANLSSIGYYDQDQLDGPFSSFYDYPTLEIKRFYKDGTPDGKEVYYAQDGTPYRINQYEEGALLSVDFIKDGKVTTLHLNEYVGKDQFTIDQFGTRTTYTIEKGTFTGPVKRTDLSKTKTLSTFTLINNKYDGVYSTFYPNGVLEDSTTFILDRRYGPQQHNNPDGKVRIKSSMLNGPNMGSRILFSPEGTPLITSNFVLDYLDGEELLYNSQGTPILALVYDLNLLVGYKNLTATEQLSEIIPINSTDTILKSTYKTGQLAAEVEIKQQLLNGVLTTYNPSGKEAYSLAYTGNDKNGVEHIYYSTGSIYSTTPYVNKSLTGIKTIYTPTGDKQFEVSYKKGELHGNFTIYEANNSKQTFSYDSGFLSQQN